MTSTLIQVSAQQENALTTAELAISMPKENIRDRPIECRCYAHLHGVDKPEEDNWVWPF